MRLKISSKQGRAEYSSNLTRGISTALLLKENIILLWQMATDKPRLAWAVVLAMEMLAVSVGNAIAIAVFWKQRSTLKRTYYLLINLSIADVSVGLGEIENLVYNVWYFKHGTPANWGTFAVLDVFSGLASLSFLTLISMERLYAIAWPFLHRTTTTRVYIYSVVITWSLPAAVTIVYLCGFAFEIISIQIATIVAASFLMLCLVLIPSSYWAIWVAKRNEDPRIPVDRREQNKKLAMTLFVVSSLSVLAWLPLTVNYIISYVVHKDQLGKLLHYTGRCLQLANSFVNPIVYYARMPEFRRTLKNLFRSTQKSPQELQAHPHRVMQPGVDINSGADPGF